MIFYKPMFFMSPDEGAGSTTKTDQAQTEPGKESTVSKTIPYDRFKEVNDTLKSERTAKEAIEKKLAEYENKKLEEEKNYLAISEKAKKEAEEARAKMTEIENKRVKERKEFSIGLEAKSQGINDIDDAIRLIDVSQIEVDENGNVVGVKEAIEKMKKDKPYLFSQENGGWKPETGKVNANAITKEELVKNGKLANDMYTNNRKEYNRIMGTNH